MEETITKYPDGGSLTIISQKHEDMLNEYIPKGCPFKDYTLSNLLKDLTNMYDWKIIRKMPLIDFVKMLMNEKYEMAIAYGNSIIDILKS